LFERDDLQAIIVCRTIQGQEPGVATVPPTILVPEGCTIGTPHGTLVWPAVRPVGNTHLRQMA